MDIPVQGALIEFKLEHDDEGNGNDAGQSRARQAPARGVRCGEKLVGQCTVSAAILGGGVHEAGGAPEEAQTGRVYGGVGYIGKGSAGLVGAARAHMMANQTKVISIAKMSTRTG